MSFSAQYPPVLTEAGDLTSEVLAKYNQEFQYLYTNLLSTLFSATTGHAHTGNGSDGMQITTSALVDNAVTTAKIADGAITAEKLAEAYKASILLAIYPVGAIYMSVVSTSPATLFGGTWAQIKDRFLLSTGDTYANGATGGEAAHTLSVAEMPSHRHTYDKFATGVHDVGTPGTTTYWLGATASNTGYEGGGEAHNNMPPYLAVYVWKRTA